MGKVQAGGRKETLYSVTNPSALPVSVARIETNCNCLKIELPKQVLAPGETVVGRARLDLRAEPSFTGILGIRANGLDQSGAVLFAIVFNAEVPRY